MCHAAASSGMGRALPAVAVAQRGARTPMSPRTPPAAFSSLSLQSTQVPVDFPSFVFVLFPSLVWNRNLSAPCWMGWSRALVVFDAELRVTLGGLQPPALVPPCMLEMLPFRGDRRRGWKWGPSMVSCWQRLLAESSLVCALCRQFPFPYSKPGG